MMSWFWYIFSVYSGCLSVERTIFFFPKKKRENERERVRERRREALRFIPLHLLLIYLHLVWLFLGALLILRSFAGDANTCASVFRVRAVSVPFAYYIREPGAEYSSNSSRGNRFPILTQSLTPSLTLSLSYIHSLFLLLSLLLSLSLSLSLFILKDDETLYLWFSLYILLILCRIFNV